LSSEGEYARKAAFDEDPYLDNVERGLAHVLTELSPLPIGLQNGEDPDANHNGIGLEVTLESRPVYIGGQVVDAITATMDPVRTATTGGPDVLGRTYAEIVQDILDAYAWGQTDDARGGCPVTPTASPSPAGGWRYC
jgi:hypothetical protein